MGVAQIRAVNGGSCTAPCRSVESASTLLCWTQPDRDGASKGLMKASHSNTGPVTRVLMGGLPGFSTIHLLDAWGKPRFASHRRSGRWIRSGTESGRVKTRFDFTGHRPSHNKWHRSCSTDSQGFPGIQNSLRESGIFS